MSRGGRWARNAAFLSFSFANTACITVFPQHRFWGHPQEAMWTSLVLLGGALAALLGLAWATRQRSAALRPLSVGLGCAVYAALLLTAGSDALRSPWVYALVVWALSFASGALMQRFDERSVQQAGLDGRVANDLSISLLRFLGMLLAPGAFSLMPPGGAAAQVLLLAMVVLVAFSGWQLLVAQERVVQGAVQGEEPGVDAAIRSAGAPSSAPAAAAVSASAPGSAAGSTPAAPAKAEWMLWAAGVLVYANYCVLASAAPFLLRDLLAQAGAMERAWLLISLVYAAAMLSNALVQWRRWAPRLAWLQGAPATLALVGACLLLPTAASAGGLLLQALASLALGAAFGLFMMGYRDHLTRQALQLQRPALLARYNQLPRWATLLAFGVLAALAGLASAQAGLSLAQGVAAYLLGSSLGVMGMGARWGRRAG